MTTAMNVMYVLETMWWLLLLVALSVAMMLVAPALVVTGFIVRRVARMSLAAVVMCAPGMASTQLVHYCEPRDMGAATLVMTSAILMTLAGFGAAATIVNSGSQNVAYMRSSRRTGSS